METLSLLEQGTFLLRREQISLSPSKQLLKATHGARGGSMGLPAAQENSGPATLPVRSSPSALELQGLMYSEQGRLRSGSEGAKLAPIPSPHYSHALNYTLSPPTSFYLFHTFGTQCQRGLLSTQKFSLCTLLGGLAF